MVHLNAIHICKALWIWSSNIIPMLPKKADSLRWMVIGVCLQYLKKNNTKLIHTKKWNDYLMFWFWKVNLHFRNWNVMSKVSHGSNVMGDHFCWWLTICSILGMCRQLQEFSFSSLFIRVWHLGSKILSNKRKIILGMVFNPLWSECSTAICGAIGLNKMQH
jgi:hypothetical protein